MSFFKVKPVLDLKIVKLQFFGLLLAISTCDFNLIQAQAANNLILNIKNGNLETFGEALAAVESAGNINIPDPYGKTPFMYAVQSPIGGSNSSGQSIALTMIQDLLKAKADITIANPINGKTALMYAAESLNDGIDQQTGQSVILEILQTLLTQQNRSKTVFLISPTLLNAKDHTGKAALDYAMSSKNFQASKIAMTLLLTPGIEPMVNLTTLQKSTHRLFYTLTQVGGTKISINPAFFNNSIVYAYNNNSSSAYNQLTALVTTIDVNAQDFTGSTALMYLAPLTAPDPTTPPTAQAIITATAQLNSDLQNPKITLDTIKNDIAAGATLNAEILNTALQLPSSNTDQVAIMQIIISNILVNAILDMPNLNLNLANISDKTAAGLAPQLTALSNLTTTQTNNIATLFSNINSGNFTGITAYNVNTQDPTQGNNGTTPLMYAAASANPQVNIQASSKFNVDYNAQDYNGQTALTYAVLGQSPTVAFQTLLAIKDSNNNSLVDVNVQDDSGMTALMNALNLNFYAPAGTIPLAQMEATVSALLTTPNLDFSLQDYSQPTPQTILDYANQLAINGMDATDAKTILSAITTAINSTYSTTLVTAINNSDLKTANQVIDNIAKTGISVDILDAAGATPLMHAAASQSSLIDPNKIPSVPIIVEIITALLNAQANVNAADNQGVTPLMYAAGSLNNAINSKAQLAIVVEIIKTLLQNYALVTMQDKNKLTAYNYANNANNSNKKAILSTLIDAANIQLFEDIQNSTVTLAIIQVDLLAGADINATDLDKNTALDYAKQLPATNKDKAQIITALTPPATTLNLGYTKQTNLKQAPAPATLQSPASVTAPTTPVKPVTAATQTPVPAPVLATTPIVPAAPIAPGKPVLKTPRAKVKTIKRAKQATTAKLPNRPSPKA